MTLVAYSYYITATVKDNTAHAYLYESDYSIFYRSTQLYFAGQNIYTPGNILIKKQQQIYNIENTNGNLNPPLFTLLMLGLGKFKFPISFALWQVLGLLAGISGVYLLQRATGIKDFFNPISLSVTAAFLSYFPVFINIKLGQLGLILLPLLVLLWLASRRDYNKWAGILLGLLISIKLFLGVFLLLFLVHRRWQLLSWTLGTLLVGFIIGLLWFGQAAYLGFYNNIQQAVWYVPNWNASVYGYLFRLIGVLGKGIPVLSLIQIIKLIYIIISIFVLGILVWLAWPRNNGKHYLQAYFDLSFAFTLSSCLFLSPLGWSYYFPYLLIAIYIILDLAQKTNHAGLFYGLTWLSLFLSAFPIHLIRHPEGLSKTNNLFWASSNFYALALLMLIIAILSLMLKQDTVIQTVKRYTKNFCNYSYVILLILAIFPANIWGNCLARIIYGS
jgi:hypothetical protein